MEELQTPETPEEEQPKKENAWQKTKEGWYDKVPLDVKQLDTILVVCFVLLGLTVLAIALDAMDIWHFFDLFR